jgi:hypothetical protein
VEIAAEFRMSEKTMENDPPDDPKEFNYNQKVG